MPVDRGICCHVGGDIVFDAAGNLILATGDDTNPFESDGYTPIDERAGRNPAFDAQRSSANTNDLRGKVLRITVGAAGGYTIPGRQPVRRPGPADPAGDLPDGAAQPVPDRVQPAHRRALRRRLLAGCVDTRTRCAARPGTASGWRSRTPGNFGWPYCATAELPYIDYDFATGESGEAFDCGAPVNESPHNTGATQLPPVTQPQVWYSYGPSAEFPALGTGGIGPMAGPAYRYDAKVASKKGSTAWPAYYDNVPLFYEWTRDYIKAFFGNGDTGSRTSRRRWTTTTRSTSSSGRTGRCTCSSTATGSSARTCRAPNWPASTSSAPRGNRAPSVTAVADTTEGPSPLTVHFSAVASRPGGHAAAVRVGLRRRRPDRLAPGQPGPHLRHRRRLPRDGHGHRPGRALELGLRRGDGRQPARGALHHARPTDQPFAFGDTVNFQVEVTDDQPIDCSRVRVTYILGHDEHGHPQTTASGCTRQHHHHRPDGTRSRQ